MAPPRDLQQGIRGSGCWQGPLAFGPSWVAHGTFLEPGAIVGPSWGDVRSPIPNTASRRLQDSPGGVSGTFLPPPGKMCTNLFNVFLASSLCHFSSCPLPFFQLLSAMPFQLLSTTAMGNMLTCLSLCHFSSCLLSALARSAAVYYRCIPSQPMMEAQPSSKLEMIVRVHHVAGWRQVHHLGAIKVKILETRKGADRLIAVTKTMSPYNEEFRFEWDVSSQLTFEVFSEGRLAKDARTLWRVTPGKNHPHICLLS